MEDQDGKQSRQVIAFSLDPLKRFTTALGVVNYQYAYDHFFMGTNFLMGDVIEEFNAWLVDVTKRKLPVDTRNDFVIPPQLDKELVDEMKKIWYGQTFLYQLKDRHEQILEQRLVFDCPDEHSMDETYIEMPPLIHLNPKSQTKDDSNPSVMIQESIPFNIAWDGYDPKQVADEIGFAYNEDDELQPMYETDVDIMDSDALVIEISRETFAKLMLIEVMEFKPRKARLFQQMSNILSSYSFVTALQKVLAQSGSSSIVEL